MVNSIGLTALFSSPRRQGNSTLLAREIIRGAGEQGCRVTTHNVARLKIRAALTENPLEKGYLPPGDLNEADKLLEKAYSLGQSLARTSHEPARLDQVA